jgi:hypothetical protein
METNVHELMRCLLIAYSASASGLVLLLWLIWRQRSKTEPARWQVERDANGRRIQERI